MCEQGINEFGIKFDALGVDGVVPPTEGNDSAPRERESVGFHAVLGEKSNVFFPQSVRVRGDITVLAVECLSWDP